MFHILKYVKLIISLYLLYLVLCIHKKNNLYYLLKNVTY